MGMVAFGHPWGHGSTQLPPASPCFVPRECAPVQVSTMAGRHKLSAHGLGDPLFRLCSPRPTWGRALIAPFFLVARECDHLLCHLHIAPGPLSEWRRTPEPCALKGAGDGRGREEVVARTFQHPALVITQTARSYLLGVCCSLEAAWGLSIWGHIT